MGALIVVLNCYDVALWICRCGPLQTKARPTAGPRLGSVPSLHEARAKMKALLSISIS